MYCLSKFCFLCHTNTTSLISINICDSDKRTLHEKLQYCIKDLKYVRPAARTKICKICGDILRVTFEFKRRCLENNNNLVRYVQQLSENSGKYSETLVLLNDNEYQQQCDKTTPTSSKSVSKTSDDLDNNNGGRVSQSPDSDFLKYLSMYDLIKLFPKRNQKENVEETNVAPLNICKIDNNRVPPTRNAKTNSEQNQLFQIRPLQVVIERLDDKIIGRLQRRDEEEVDEEEVDEDGDEDECEDEEEDDSDDEYEDDSDEPQPKKQMTLTLKRNLELITKIQKLDELIEEEEKKNSQTINDKLQDISSGSEESYTPNIEILPSSDEETEEIKEEIVEDETFQAETSKAKTPETKTVEVEPVKEEIDEAGIIEEEIIELQTIKEEIIDTEIIDAETVAAETIEAVTIEAETVEAETVEAATVDKATVETDNEDTSSVSSVDSVVLPDDNLEEILNDPTLDFLLTEEERKSKKYGRSDTIGGILNTILQEECKKTGVVTSKEKEAILKKCSKLYKNQLNKSKSYIKKKLTKHLEKFLKKSRNLAPEVENPIDFEDLITAVPIDKTVRPEPEVNPKLDVPQPKIMMPEKKWKRTKKLNRQLTLYKNLPQNNNPDNPETWNMWTLKEIPKLTPVQTSGINKHAEPPTTAMQMYGNTRLGKKILLQEVRQKKATQDFEQMMGKSTISPVPLVPVQINQYILKKHPVLKDTYINTNLQYNPTYKKMFVKNADLPLTAIHNQQSSLKHQLLQELQIAQEPRLPNQQMSNNVVTNPNNQYVINFMPECSTSTMFVKNTDLPLTAIQQQNSVKHQLLQELQIAQEPIFPNVETVNTVVNAPNDQFEINLMPEQTNTNCEIAIKAEPTETENTPVNTSILYETLTRNTRQNDILTLEIVNSTPPELSYFLNPQPAETVLSDPNINSSKITATNDISQPASGAKRPTETVLTDPNVKRRKRTTINDMTIEVQPCEQRPVPDNVANLQITNVRSVDSSAGEVNTSEEVGQQQLTADTNFNVHRCHICSKPFLSARNLKKHLPTHAAIYECSICHTEFKFKYSLQQHLNLHKGENVFLCPFCPLQYGHIHGLKKHCHLVHNYVPQNFDTKKFSGDIHLM